MIFFHIIFNFSREIVTSTVRFNRWVHIAYWNVILDPGPLAQTRKDYEKSKKFFSTINMDKEVTADRICAASDDIVTMASDNQGPRSKLSSGGAKEECVKENLGGGGGACLWIPIQFL